MSWQAVKASSRSNGGPAQAQFLFLARKAAGAGGGARAQAPASRSSPRGRSLSRWGIDRILPARRPSCRGGKPPPPRTGASFWASPRDQRRRRSRAESRFWSPGALGLPPLGSPRPSACPGHPLAGRQARPRKQERPAGENPSQPLPADGLGVSSRPAGLSLGDPALEGLAQGRKTPRVLLGGEGGQERRSASCRRGRICTTAIQRPGGGAPGGLAGPASLESLAQEAPAEPGPASRSHPTHSLQGVQGSGQTEPGPPLRAPTAG